MHTTHFAGYAVSAQKVGVYYQLEFRKAGVRLGQISSRCSSLRQAMHPDTLRERLKEFLARPGVMQKLQDGTPRSPSKKSLFGCLDRLANQIGQHWKSLGSSASLVWTVNFIKRELGPALGGLHIKKVPPDQYNELRAALRTGCVSPADLAARAQSLTRITKALIKLGLSAQCEKAFDGFRASSQTEAVDEAYTYADTRQMLDKLSHQNFTNRMLFWLAFSGGPELVEAAKLERSQVCLETGKVTFAPAGTIAPASFVLVAEGLECLRQQPFEGEDFYLFPELIFTDTERLNPGHNRKVDLSVLKRKVKLMRNANEGWRDFMAVAGIDSTHKSFGAGRKELVAYLLSMKFKESVVASVLGVVPVTLLRYSFPAEWELYCERDIRQQHLTAIRMGKDRERRFVISRTDLLREAQDFVQHYLSSIETLLAGHHEGLKAEAVRATTSISKAVSQQLTSHENREIERDMALASQIDAAGSEAGRLVADLRWLRTEIEARCDRDAFDLPPAATVFQNETAENYEDIRGDR